MDLSAVSSLGSIAGPAGVNAQALSDALKGTTQKTDGTLFDTVFKTALDNIKTTNSYLSDAENEELKFALGQTNNTHDLTIALQKASTALQYTVAIRDKILEAYKEIMQMQI